MAKGYWRGISSSHILSIALILYGASILTGGAAQTSDKQYTCECSGSNCTRTRSAGFTKEDTPTPYYCSAQNEATNESISMCCSNTTVVNSFTNCEAVQNYTSNANADLQCVVNITAQACESLNSTYQCTKMFLLGNTTCLAECPCGYETINNTYCQMITETVPVLPPSTKPNATTCANYMYHDKCQELCAPSWVSFHLYKFGDDKVCTSKPNKFMILLIACPVGALVLVVIIIVTVVLYKRGQCCQCQCVCSCPTRDDESLDHKHHKPPPDAMEAAGLVMSKEKKKPKQPKGGIKLRTLSKPNPYRNKTGVETEEETVAHVDYGDVNLTLDGLNQNSRGNALLNSVAETNVDADDDQELYENTQPQDQNIYGNCGNGYGSYGNVGGDAEAVEGPQEDYLAMDMGAQQSHSYFPDQVDEEGQEDYEVPEQNETPTSPTTSPQPQSDLLRQLTQLTKTYQQKKRSDAKSPPPVTKPKPVVHQEEDYDYSDNTTRGFVPPSHTANRVSADNQGQYADNQHLQSGASYDAAETAHIHQQDYDDENIYQNVPR